MVSRALEHIERLSVPPPSACRHQPSNCLLRYRIVFTALRIASLSCHLHPPLLLPPTRLLHLCNWYFISNILICVSSCASLGSVWEGQLLCCLIIKSGLQLDLKPIALHPCWLDTSHHLSTSIQIPALVQFMVGHPDPKKGTQWKIYAAKNEIK